MYTTRKIITNEAEATVEVGLEPWGLYLPLEPGCSLDVVAEAPEAGELVIEHGAQLIIYGWPGSNVKVYRDGQLIHSVGVALPERPSATSTPAFMKLMGRHKKK